MFLVDLWDLPQLIVGPTHTGGAAAAVQHCLALPSHYPEGATFSSATKYFHPLTLAGGKQIYQWIL